ncbi:MAG: hypothetical protein KGJ86_12245 [Chloroflexota bacterium]|nr:hypothetical protein [Chloroflexota bacterium]
MNVRERLVTLGTAATLACLMVLAWVTPLLAEGEDGDGFDGDELWLPIIIGGVIVVAAVTLWRNRRPRGRQAEEVRTDK